MLVGKDYLKVFPKFFPSFCPKDFQRRFHHRNYLSSSRALRVKYNYSNFLLHKQGHIFLHVSFQLWFSSGLWSCATWEIIKIQMGRKFPVLQTFQSCGGQMETEKSLRAGSNVSALHSVGSASRECFHFIIFYCSDSQHWRELTFSFSFNLFLKLPVPFLYGEFEVIFPESPDHPAEIVLPQRR